MLLKTFIADDMKDALTQVRSAMGDAAIIVSSQKTKGGGVMVRAAVDPADEECAIEAVEDAPAAAVNADSDGRFRNALIQRLRRPPADGDTRQRFDRAALLTLCARQRLPDSLAHRLAERAEASKRADMTLALAAAIDAHVQAAPIDFVGAKALMLIGLNGAGKTATAAKLAAHAGLAGRRVILIGTDTQGAGAMARLESFAEHLNVGVVSAATASSLADRVRECGQSGQLAIIDTAGFDPREPKTATAMRALAGIAGIETLGIVSAMGDGEDAAEITEALADSGATRLIVTQTDLAKRRGALIAAALVGLPFAYFAGSPFVAGPLETPSPLMLARLIVDADTESLQ